MIKARVTRLLALLFFLISASTVFASGKIYYGIWSQGWPSGSGQAVADYYDLLTNTLKFNLIVGVAPPDRLSYLSQYELKAIGQNIGLEITPYPEMYAHMSTYITFFAKRATIQHRLVARPSFSPPQLQFGRCISSTR